MQAGERLHLIGSIPLGSSEEVFRTLAKELGPHLNRIPDGETGERSRWVYFQGQMLRAHPAMEIDPTVPPFPFVQWDGKVVREIPQVRFKPGVDHDKVVFETGKFVAPHGLALDSRGDIYVGEVSYTEFPRLFPEQKIAWRMRSLQKLEKLG